MVDLGKHIQCKSCKAKDQIHFFRATFPLWLKVSEWKVKYFQMFISDPQGISGQRKITQHLSHCQSLKGWFLIYFFIKLEFCWNNLVCQDRLLCPWNSTGKEYWSGLLRPPPGDLLDPGIEPMSPTSLALAGEFFTICGTREVHIFIFLHSSHYI